MLVAPWASRSKRRTLRLSVLGGGGNSDDEYLNNIEQNIIDINKFREKYPGEITIDVIECKLATNSPSKKIIKKATDLLNQNDLIPWKRGVSL